jgi:hypothetical protein
VKTPKIKAMENDINPSPTHLIFKSTIGFET